MIRLLSALLAWTAFPALAMEVAAVRNGNDLVIHPGDLDTLRLRGGDLRSELVLPDGTTLAIDWSDPAIQQSLVVDLTGSGPVNTIQFRLAGETRTVPVTTVTTPDLGGGTLASMERGTSWTGDLPRIALPDESALPVATLAKPAREIAVADITHPVVSSNDLPVLGSQNVVLLVNGRLYVSYRKAVIDETTLRVSHWRKFLVEVPVDPAWAGESGDAVVTLPPGSFRVHTSDERTAKGHLILGETQAGLAQGGQSVDTDEAGRIYFSNLERGAGIVRFDPATARFEPPPVDFAEAIASLLPPDPVWRRSWDMALGELLVCRNRLYLVFARNYRVESANGKAEACSGVISLPLDHWDDDAAFRADLRLHSGCWEDAPNSLYRGDLAVADYASRKLAPPFETDAGFVVPAAAGSRGGPWVFELDAQGNVTRFSEGGAAPAPKRIAGLRKQRFINVGGAGRPLLEFDCGELRIARAAVPLLLPGAVVADAKGDFLTRANDTPGILTVRYDVSEMARSSESSVVQGPAYALTAIPGVADQAIGVCEYGYYFSRLDFSRIDRERRVLRTYLPNPGGGPAQVGLGPYHSLWRREDEALWLYLPGYIGISRLKVSERGVFPDAFVAEAFHERLQSRSIDGVARDPIKDYRDLFPGLGGRLLAIGRGRPGRGGGPFSTGLELFDPRSPDDGQAALRMTRGFDLWTPVSRLVIRASDGSQRQEVFAASSAMRPDYARELSAQSDLPGSVDPKLFAWEIDPRGSLRDRFGFALPCPAQLVLSRCGQYLVILRDDGVLMSWQITRRRFADAMRLPAQPIEFSRPGHRIWSAPDGRLFFMTAGDGVRFHEVAVALDGRITLSGHLTLTGAQAAHVDGVVRGFLPDLARMDGSCDLVLGSRPQGDDPAVRVIRDFIPPR
jgi:hypothetical protein